MLKPPPEAEPDERELARLSSLLEYFGVDAPEIDLIDAELQQFVELAKVRTGAEVAQLNLVGRFSQRTLLDADGRTTPLCSRWDGLCPRVMYATGEDSVFVTCDARHHEKLCDSPFVVGPKAAIRFYAGAALMGREGLPLGMLCVWSERPFDVKQAQTAVKALVPLRDAVMQRLETIRDTRSTLQPSGQPSGPSAGAPLPGQSPGARATGAADGRRRARPGAGSAIDALIDNGAVETYFQPIVHLGTREVVGFEALSRGPAGTDLASPLAMLQAAAEAGRLGELDWLCRASAVRAASASGLDPSLSWFVNVEPAGLRIPCPSHLRRSLEHARANLRVVLEIVEREVEGNATRLLRAAEQARQDAWGVALDDVGAEVGSLALLPFLQPDVVKLDMSLVHDLPDEKAAETIAAVHAYAERTNAVILAEGIETELHEELAKVYGATYGQGYRYGRPGPLPAFVPAPTHPVPLLQKPSPVAELTPYDIVSQRVRPEVAREEMLAHMVEYVKRQSTRSEDSGVLLASFDQPVDAAATRSELSALADHNALTVGLVADFPDPHLEPRLYIGELAADNPLRGERVIIAVTPHFAAALMARPVADRLHGPGPTYEFLYTHNRDLVIAAGRAFLDLARPDLADELGPLRAA